MEFINDAISFFNQILDFTNNRIYQFVTEVFGQFVIWATVGLIKFKIMMLVFAWDVAQQIMAELNLSSYINAAFASLDSDLFGFICFFHIPEFVNIVVSALVTRYVLNFMGSITSFIL